MYKQEMQCKEVYNEGHVIVTQCLAGSTVILTQRY